MVLIRIWAMALLLIGWAPTAMAEQTWLNAPETLRYNVSWGPISMGRATLSYTPGPAEKNGSIPYIITAEARDNVSIVELDNRYIAAGTHTPKQRFVPQNFEAIQAENDYRAHKKLLFDARKRLVIPTNLRNPADSPKATAWPAGTADIFSSVYAFRAKGIEAIKGGGSIEVMDYKKPYLLSWPPAKLVEQNKEMMWRVALTATDKNGKSGQPWVVYLRNTGNLTPALIIANLKFGSFRATLRK